jgi:hypothetical protein
LCRVFNAGNLRLTIPEVSPLATLWRRLQRIFCIPKHALNKPESLMIVPINRTVTITVVLKADDFLLNWTKDIEFNGFPEAFASLHSEFF